MSAPPTSKPLPEPLPEPLSEPPNSRAQAVLGFWFKAPTDTDDGQYRKAWFLKRDAFDQQIRQRFHPDVENAAVGEYDHWQSHPYSAVALLLLLDQFPRNLYRGRPQSFATDSKALQIAQHLVTTGLDRALPPTHRFFIYVVFEHSESLDSQHQCVELMSALLKQHPHMAAGFKSGLDYAIRHRDVIARFGRFPHRNEILGRVSTAAELDFLQQPGSRF